ncbi:hypothetical protein CPB86DRAFT_815896 [Serendipita vermifera]|nr:hypothetical protein CPB86DRAFT_815896 [Serendipita vermifera]
MSSENVRELPPAIRFSKSAKPSTAPYLASGKRSLVPTKQTEVLSLSAYCINALYPRLHQISDLESCWTRRSYDSPRIVEMVVDLLPQIPARYLRPPFKSDSNEFEYYECQYMIHPQLWGLLNALIIPSTLPLVLRTISVAITDGLIPSLHHAPVLATPSLSLLTALSLESVESRLLVTDDSIIQLRNLACLTVLNLASTPITSRGILRLVLSITSSDNPDTCPWRLRVLDLRNTFVGDMILEPGKGRHGITSLPLLCAIDLRNTQVNDDVCKTAQEKWKEGSTVEPDRLLFYPNGTAEITKHLCQLLEERNATNSTPASQKQHALMFMDRVDYPMQQSYSVGEIGLTAPDPRRLAESSGVVVLTPTDHILGNIYEDHGISEGNLSLPRFQATSRSVDHISGRSNTAKSLAKSNRAAITPQLAHEMDDWDETLVLYRIAPVYDTSQLSSYIAKLTAKVSSDAPAPATSQKRKWNNNEAFAVKRFKGSPFVHLFGSKPSPTASRPI